MVWWIIGYPASAVAAFWLLQHDWRRTLDVSAGEIALFAFLALLGPVGLATGLIVNATSMIGRRLPEGVIWRRRT